MKTRESHHKNKKYHHNSYEERKKKPYTLFHAKSCWKGKIKLNKATN